MATAVAGPVQAADASRLPFRLRKAPRVVYWLANRALSPLERHAINEVHGDGVEIQPVPFHPDSFRSLAKFVSGRDGFVYTDAPMPDCIYAAVEGETFGFFQETYDGKDRGVAVYHVGGSEILMIWNSTAVFKPGRTGDDARPPRPKYTTH